MKTKNLLSAIVIILLFISCKKNSDQSSITTSSKFTYDGNEYSLDKGYIHPDVGTRFDVSFFSSSVSVMASAGLLVLNGPGAGFLLTLDSTTPTELVTGTYKWPSQTTPGSPMIAFAQMGRSNEITNTISGGFRDAEYGTGSVTVSKSGQEYTIEFSLSIDGKTASGKYIGTLNSY
jgi:hypothetical protein